MALRLRSKSVKTVRPPNLSVKMPSGMLTAAAKNGSIAARMSTWVALKLYHLIRNGAIAENMPQTAKRSEKARSATNKIRALPGGSAIASTATTRLSTAPSYKKLLLFAGYIRIAGSPALAPTDKAPPPSLIATPEQCPHGFGDTAIVLGFVRFARIFKRIEKTGRSRRPLRNVAAAPRSRGGLSAPSEIHGACPISQRST